MKKLLAGLMLISVLLFSAIGVMAVDQGLTVIIGEDVNLIITPSTVDFGTVQPGINNNPAINGPIIFDATGSNVDVNVEVTAVTGFPFEDGLMLDGAPALAQDWDLLCVLVEDVCSYTTATTVPTLDVPLSAPQGTKPGTITYTVTGSPPA